MMIRFLGICVLTAAAIDPAQAQEGFTNTPMIPGSPWHLHDSTRPLPPIVTPGTNFSQMADAPSDATVLFDGKDLSQWESVDGSEPKWRVENGYIQATRGGNIRTKAKFPDFQLHVEFAEPTVIRGDGQDRGNSGIIINGMYEVQILDSYKNPTYADGQGGAIYGQDPPLVNPNRPPGEWQTYDIIFEVPRWDDAGQLTKKANVTVLFNGVVVHHKFELTGRTDGLPPPGAPWKTLGTYPAPMPPEAFVELQIHGTPIRFRNIWIRPLAAQNDRKS